MGRTLGDDASGVEYDDSLAEGEDFVAAMGHVEDRDAVGAVPFAQILDYQRLGWGIESGQRFIEKQNFGICDQRSRQSDTLALSARNFPGTALGQMGDAEGAEDRCDAPGSVCMR